MVEPQSAGIWWGRSVSRRTMSGWPAPRTSTPPRSTCRAAGQSGFRTAGTWSSSGSCRTGSWLPFGEDTRSTVELAMDASSRGILAVSSYSGIRVGTKGRDRAAVRATSASTCRCGRPAQASCGAGATRADVWCGNHSGHETVLSCMSISRWRFLKFWPSLAMDPPCVDAQMRQRRAAPGARVPGMAPPGCPA